MISYLIHSSILLSVCFTCYWVLLKKETFYKLNRFLLLGIIVCTLVLPSIKIPYQWSLKTNSTLERVFTESENVTNAGTSVAVSNDDIDNVKSEISNKPHKLSLLEISTYIYFTGGILFICAFLIQFFLLLYRKNKLEFIQDGPVKIFELNNTTPPFSFYKWIFINPTLYDNETYEQIIAHEKIHIKQSHFIDKVISEIALILFWFNPFMWFMRNAISNNLEFITDKQMLQNGIKPELYQMNLLQVSVSQHPLNITTNYNQSILKKRIIMMDLKQSSAKSSWKYLTFIPILLFSVLTLNATYSPINTVPSITEQDPDIERKVHQEIITKELQRTSLLSIDNVTGGIKVEGYAGNTIKVEIEKVITATSNEELERGILETDVQIVESNQGQHLFLNSPYSTFNEETQEFSYKNNCDNGPCFSYEFQLHYTVKVPFETSLTLSTINGGDIEIKEVIGDKLIAKHISGSIYLEDISGATDAFTISGGIKASYRNNPTASSSYVTTSGHIKIDYVEGLNAQVTYEIKDGQLETDFDAVSLSKKKFKHSKTSLKSPVRIGSGKVDLFFKTTSGNVVLSKI